MGFSGGGRRGVGFYFFGGFEEVCVEVCREATGWDSWCWGGYGGSGESAVGDWRDCRKGPDERGAGVERRGFEIGRAHV